MWQNFFIPSNFAQSWMIKFFKQTSPKLKQHCKVIERKIAVLRFDLVSLITHCKCEQVEMKIAPKLKQCCSVAAIEEWLQMTFDFVNKIIFDITYYHLTKTEYRCKPTLNFISRQISARRQQRTDWETAKAIFFKLPRNIVWVCKGKRWKEMIFWI